MRRTVVLLASMALAVVLCSAVSGGEQASAQASPPKPNFVFILADDMRKDDLKYMPKTRSLLGEKGMRFNNAYASYGLCCPSRATIMRGQYAHNHGVWHNDLGGVNSTDGGWYGYKFNGNEEDNVATRLHESSYRTGFFGKYLNGYDGSAVPVGWSDWFAMASNKG
jgi:N-acetylglucosamine-6-sulfatase